MSTAEFDGVADVYDETRRALDEQTLAGLKEMLEKHGCRSILEVGIGTGRVSSPLKRSGYEVAGVDISRRMMERAKKKGIADLVLADGGWMPFRGKTFDAALMAHVFHLLDDPLTVMREAARVTRVGVFALVRKRDPDRPWFPFFGPPSGTTADERASKFLEERRERFRQIGEKYHWDWERSRRHRRNWGREREVLETHPPDDLKVVSDVMVSETMEERISRFEKGGYGFITEMPPEMRQEVLCEMRTSASSAPEWTRQPRHEVYELAMWRSGSLLHAARDSTDSPDRPVASGHA